MSSALRARIAGKAVAQAAEDDAGVGRLHRGLGRGEPISAEVDQRLHQPEGQVPDLAGTAPAVPREGLSPAAGTGPGAPSGRP